MNIKLNLDWLKNPIWKISIYPAIIVWSAKKLQIRCRSHDFFPFHFIRSQICSIPLPPSSTPAANKIKYISFHGWCENLLPHFCSFFLRPPQVEVKSRKKYLTRNKFKSPAQNMYTIESSHHHQHPHQPDRICCASLLKADWINYDPAYGGVLNWLGWRLGLLLHFLFFFFCCEVIKAFENLRCENLKKDQLILHCLWILELMEFNLLRFFTFMWLEIQNCNKKWQKSQIFQMNKRNILKVAIQPKFTTSNLKSPYLSNLKRNILPLLQDWS